jgi:hypothetical protein
MRSGLLRYVRGKSRFDHGPVHPPRVETKRRGRQLASTVEEGRGPRMVTPNDHQATHSPVPLPECRAGGGVYPGVDLNDITTLLDRMGNRD